MRMIGCSTLLLYNRSYWPSPSGHLSGLCTNPQPINRPSQYEKGERAYPSEMPSPMTSAINPIDVG